MIYAYRGFAFFIAVSVISAPAMSADDWAGIVKAASGPATVERAGTASPIALGDKVMARDKLVTGKDGKIAVTLRDDTRISLGENTQISLNEFGFDPSTQGGSVFVSVLRGVTAMVSGLVARANPQAMKISTPMATIGIRGTEFVVVVEDAK